MLARQKKPLPADHRVLLDWLCRQPARVFDFTEVADGTKMKRGEVEKVLRDLRHQRFGAVLADKGPDGFSLRPRFAYLPAKSKAREGYPAVTDTTVEGVEHPALTAAKNAHKAEQERLAEEAKKRSEEGRRIGAVAANYKKAKADAREKAAANAAPRTKLPREVTGQIYVPEGSGVLGPPLSLVIPQPDDGKKADEAVQKSTYKKANTK